MCHVRFPLYRPLFRLPPCIRHVCYPPSPVYAPLTQINCRGGGLKGRVRSGTTRNKKPNDPIEALLYRPLLWQCSPCIHPTYLSCSSCIRPVCLLVPLSVTLAGPNLQVQLLSSRDRVRSGDGESQKPNTSLGSAGGS